MHLYRYDYVLRNNELASFLFIMTFIMYTSLDWKSMDCSWLKCVSARIWTIKFVNMLARLPVYLNVIKYRFILNKSYNLYVYKQIAFHITSLFFVSNC